MAYRVDFHTTEYQMAHGHTPRGRGSWAFFPNHRMIIDEAFWTPSCTYGEAKKLARAWAREKGITLVYVGS